MGKEKLQYTISTLPAFTLMQVIVSMVLFSVFISIVAMIILNMNQLFSIHQRNIESVSEVIVDYQVISYDFEKCLYIRNSGNESFVFVFSDTEILYTIDNSHIKRIQNNDTLIIACIAVDFETLTDNDEIISSLAIYSKLNADTVPMIFIKNYTNDFLLNIQNYHEY